MTQALQAVTDQWFVTNGVVALGPVDFGRLASGVAHGRIPESSFVRHQSWKVWRKLTEIGGLSAADREETVRRLAGMNSVAEERAADPTSYPPPPLAPQAPFPAEPESQPPQSAVRAASVDPVGVLSRALDLDEALLLSLSTAVAASKADAGLLYRARPEQGALIVACAQGLEAETLLGMRLRDDDPSLVAARAGRTILGEPLLGDAGRHIAGRFTACLSGVRGVAMVPVVVFGELTAMVELARQDAPFRAREIARVEDVVEALAARAVVQGWV